MENFNGIKSIWEQELKVSNSNDIAIDSIITQHIRNKKHKKIANSILLFTLLIIIVYLIGFTGLHMWTTYAGLFIFFIVSCYLIYIKWNKSSGTSDLELLDNQDFLSALKREKDETCVGTIRQQTRLFIFYAIGFGFYIFEIASRNLDTFLIGYGALLVYLLAVKFFYFPLIARRNRRKADQVINRINALQHQFEEHE